MNVFATFDAASSGRAEVMIGHGSLTESFALFGLPLDRYEQLFDEKLDLFAALISQDAVTWSGETRSPLVKQRVFPKTEKPLRTWVGVGASPQSIVRTARYGLPVILSIIGGDPLRFRPFVELFNQALAQLGKSSQPIAIHSSGHIAATDREAREEYWPDYKRWHEQLGAERGWPPAHRETFEIEVEHGSLYVGSPETVARKIAKTVRGLDASRFQLTYSNG